MSRNKIILLVFAFVALAQMAVPAMMIIEREHVLKEGKEFKFRSAPRDPYDPFRGKYITMQYASNQIEVAASSSWEHGETVYVMFTEDEEGYAIIESVSKSAPEHTADYLKTTVQYFDNYYENESGTATLSVDYPFDRLYMEESKAFEAEMAYNESVQFDWETEELWEGEFWSEEDWKRNIKELNQLYEALQDSLIDISSYSYTLDEYNYLIREFEEQCDINLDEYLFAEMEQLQRTVNGLDYVSFAQEEEIVEDEPEEMTESVAYSLVAIKNGRAVLKDVLIDEVAIKDVVLSNREEEEKGH